MKDRTRLAITGAVALAAVAFTVGGHGVHLNLGDDNDVNLQLGHSKQRVFTGLKDFQGVRLAGPDDVKVVHGNGFAVVAKGDPRAVDALDIKVVDGVLVIGRKSGLSRHMSSDGAEIRVTLPSLVSASLAGPGDMDVDRMEGKTATASLSGPGDLRIGQLVAEQADLQVTGPGSLTVAGKVRTASLAITGPGDLRADELESGHADLKLLGSGDITARATGDATISVTGPGHATVSGTNNCRINKIGPGDAECSA